MREIERALEGRLRARHISEAFITRWEDDSIQKAFAEYLRALAEGREIENRDAFIVDVAFKRAVDEIRAEVRHENPATLAAIVDRSGGPAPAAEEEATDHLLAAELHKAMDELSAEKRQALRLYYFEEKTIKECAELLFVSETGFRRVLRAAVATLRRRLGVEIPGPETPLGIEIGLAAWVVSAGGLTPMASGLVDHLAAIGGNLRRGFGATLDKLRELAWRPPPAAGEESLRTLAASPFGRVAGACAGVVACALGGVAIWSGTSDRQPQPAPQPTRVAPAHRVAETPSRPPDQPVVRHPRQSRQTASRSTAQNAERKSAARPRVENPTADARVANAHQAHRSSQESEEEVAQVQTQTSGTVRAENDSTIPSSTSAEPTASATPEATAPPSTPSPAPSKSQASEEAQVEEQFGAFK